MKQPSSARATLVLLGCGMGAVGALLHWLVPTRLLLGNPAEFACAAAAAVLNTAALLLLCAFAVLQIRDRQGLCGEGTFCLPALLWSLFGLLCSAGASVAKLIRGIDCGFVPVQTEGMEWSFSVLTLLNLPALCCFAVLLLLARRKSNQ